MGLAAIALVAPAGVSDNAAVGGDADIAGAVKATTAAVLVGGAAGLALPLASLSSAAAPSLLFCRMYLLCQIGSTTSTMAWF